MRLGISGLKEFRERLERLRSEEVMAQALAEQAERMAQRVREGLSQPSGAADHDRPWLQSGALRDSVGTQADGLQAVVGSSDPASAPQEMGTAKMQPRPFLAPTAASMGEEVAQAIGARVAAALKGGSFDPGGVRLVSQSGKTPEDMEGVPLQDRLAVEQGLETPGRRALMGCPIRFANGDWSDLPRLFPVIDLLIQRAGWSAYVMRTYLTLCERAAAAFPIETFTRHVGALSDEHGSFPPNWSGSNIAARISGVVQILVEANHPLTRLQARDLLTILDRLVDMGDRRPAALQQSEHFRGVQLAA